MASGGGEEVAAAVPLLRLLHVHQAKIDIVHESGSLQRLTRDSWAIFCAASLRSSS